MANSSILGGTRAPAQASGKDVDLLGPSDTSDSGSDVQGERAMPTAPDNPGEWGSLVTDTGNDSDAFGTGERSSADGDAPVDGADILPDRVIDGDLDEVSMDAADLPDDAEDEDDLDVSDDDDGESDGAARPAPRTRAGR